MRLSTFLFYHILLYSSYVIGAVYPWVEDDLVGGQSTDVKFVDDGYEPLLVDLLFFEVVIFSGGNDAPITLYTSRRYDFSEATEIDAPDSTMLGKESYYVISLFVPWSIGPNIARGYYLGLRSHLNQNESVEMISYTNRVSMLNNGTLSPDIEEAAKAQGQLSTSGPVSSWACVGRPCSEEMALSGINLTARKPEKTQQPLNENQKFTIAFSATMGGITLILLAGVIWRCRQSRMERKDSKRRWWNKIPPPDTGASELPGRVGPYTTAELGGDGHRGSVFELQAGINQQDCEGADSRKDIASMEASELDETQRLRRSEDSSKQDSKTEVLYTLREEERVCSQARDVDEILPVLSKPSLFVSAPTRKRDIKHNSAPTPVPTTRPPRDSSPHETTAMLGSSSPDPSNSLASEVATTRPASFPLLQHHSQYESIPRQSARMADADLEALAGAFALPAPNPKPSPRKGGWIYR